MSDKKGLVAASAHLAGHIFIGSIMFCVVAIAAGMLEKLVHFLKDQGISETVITVLGYVEHLLFFIDILCFVIMLLAAAYKFLREVFKEVTSE